MAALGVSRSRERHPEYPIFSLWMIALFSTELWFGDCTQVSKVLADYEKESRQKLNKEKNSLFLSKNTSLEIQEMAKETFGA